MADGSGDVTLVQGYTPFGVPLWHAGSSATGYSFTGEQWEAYAQLLFLRARYYQPGTGRFINKDLWPGDQLHPRTHNTFVYASNNPANWVDASGFLSSSPIEAMIQTKYVETYLGVYRFGIEPEYYIPGGSKQGLELDTSGPEPKLTGNPTGCQGFADLVGFWSIGGGDLYEIKHKRNLTWAIAEVNWYIKTNNALRQQSEFLDRPILVPGIRYTWAPAEEIIGTNPFYSDQWIAANMQAAGVISWWGKRKTENERLPRYVWEWDPVKRKVEKRELVAVSAYEACSSSELSRISGEDVGTVVVIGAAVYVVVKVIKAAVGFMIAGPPGAAVGLAIP